MNQEKNVFRDCYNRRESKKISVFGFLIVVAKKTQKKQKNMKSIIFLQKFESRKKCFSKLLQQTRIKKKSFCF